MAAFLARQERFAVVGSTNDVVRGWLADGTPEICLAVADEQTAGRGREDRTWSAPAGAALLLSLGFRPVWLEPAQVWRLAAVVSLTMAEAAEAIAGLPARTIHLKWPNDLVESSGEWLAGASPSTSEGSDPGHRFEFRKLAGVLGETDGLGGPDPRAIIGIGVNTDWPRAAFPAELAGTMTSLLEASADGSVDNGLLLDAFLARLEGPIAALRAGRFDAEAWAARQVTTGRDVELLDPNGVVTRVHALGVDGGTGALIVEDGTVPGGERQVVVGEIRHVRLPVPTTPAAAAV